MRFYTGRGSVDFWGLGRSWASLFAFFALFFAFFVHLSSKSRFEPIFFNFGSIFGGFWKVLGGFRGGFFDVFLLLYRKTRFCEN